MEDPHHDVVVDDGIEPSSSSTSTQMTQHHPNDDTVGASSSSNVVVPISSPSVAATSVEENIPSSRTSEKESAQDMSYESDMSSHDDDDGTTFTYIKSIISWQQLNETMRNELFYEGKSPTWREEWFGVHLPPSAVARGAPTILVEVEEEVLESVSLLPDQDEEEDDVVELVDHTEELESEVEIPVEEPPPPPPPPKQTTLPAVNTPPVEEISQIPPKTTTEPTFVSLISTLLSSPGPSIPLYPALLLLTTLYILKQIFNCLFGFKSRTRVTRSMNRVLLNKKQFVIPKDQLLQHIEWMRLRSDLRRMRERNSRKMLGLTENKENDERNHDNGEGGGSGSSGMNGRYGDNSGNSGSGGGYRDNSDSNDKKDNSDNGTNGNGSGQTHTNHNTMLGLLKADNICPTRKILMLAELFAEVMGNKDKEIAVLNSKIEETERAGKESREKASTFEMRLAEVTGKKEKEIAVLKSKIDEIERANAESSKNAATFEKQCKEMQEQVALLKEEVAMLELVCEKMQDGELAGLEIEGENCLRSCLGSLTNVNEEDEDSMASASTDSEWDRLEEENKLLRAENELLQESLDCLRKEFEEVRSDAANVDHELKPVKFQRDLSPTNDATMEMTDASFECMDSNTTTPFKGMESPVRAESVTSSPQPSSPSSNSEVINTIQTLLKKCAQDTQRTPEEYNSPKNLNQDLLQLLANVRKLDGDHSKENVRANSPRKRPNSPRKRDRTKDLDTSGRGRSRQRAGIRSKILFKSPLARIREKSFSGRKSPSSLEEIAK